MKKIIINGRFLTQEITGVQRVAHEVLYELDKILEEYKEKIEILVLAPKNTKKFDNLKNIKIKRVGYLKGHFWEQIELPIYIYIEKGRLLNLQGSAPIIKSGIVTIHDISFKANKKFYSKSYSIYYGFLTWILTKTSEKILTVSEFSKKEIMKYYGVSKDKIEVVYNSWEHILKIKEDFKILKKFNLEKKSFYLAVSSIAPNKNFKYIIELAKLYPEKKFVIVGKKNIKVFGKLGVEKLKNLIWCGYVTDRELKALYMSCEGFIYPSFYEGFGLPPLEAIGCGCKKVYISNTSCLPEIYQDSVEYLNPYKPERILERTTGINEHILKKYNWQITAKNILKIIK